MINKAIILKYMEAKTSLKNVNFSINQLILGLISLSLFCSSCQSSETISQHMNVSPQNESLEDKIYFNDFSGIVYCLNVKDGKENWKINFEDGFDGSLTIDKENGYLGRDKLGFISFNLKDRKIQWKNILNDGSLSTPFVSQDNLFLGIKSQYLTNVNKKTGQTIWQFEDPNFGNFHYIGGYEKNTIYASTDLTFLYTLFSFNSMTGKVNWSAQTESEIIANPAFYSDLVITIDFIGNVTAYNKETGRVVWNYLSDYNTNPTNIEIIDDEVFVVSETGTLYCLNVKTGFEKWKLNLGKGLSSSICSSGNLIFFNTSNGELIAYDVKLRKNKWVLSTGGIKAIPTFYNNTMFFGNNSGEFQAIDFNAGTKIWSYKCQEKIWSSPSILTKDGKIYRGFGDIKP